MMKNVPSKLLRLTFDYLQNIRNFDGYHKRLDVMRSGVTMKLFKIDSPVFQFLTRSFDIMFLNILWVICSIPIITIGASTAALYYSTLKIIREKDSGMAKMFFYSFFQNLKQGIKMSIITLVTGVFLYADIQACKMMNGTLGNVARIVLVILLVIWGMTISYAFPLLAQFENTIKNTLKNALIISLNNFKKTIIIVFLNSIPFVLFFLLPHVFLMSVPLWLLFGAAAIAYINARSLVKIFDKYM